MFVYIVAASGLSLYKIGASGSPPARLRALRASSPIELELVVTIAFAHGLAAAQAVRFIHKHLATLRQHSEWFTLSSEQLEETINLLKQMSAKRGH